ncbi:MAG: hypothetical protein ACTSSE_19485 [Candidatus Thorarchaeota archaeon]
MSNIRQTTLSGKVLPMDPDDEKSLMQKVSASFQKSIVFAKNGFGDKVPGKKYKAVFSSAPTHVKEILTSIAQECPDAIKEWFQENQELLR